MYHANAITNFLDTVVKEQDYISKNTFRPNKKSAIFSRAKVLHPGHVFKNQKVFTGTVSISSRSSLCFPSQCSRLPLQIYWKPSFSSENPPTNSPKLTHLSRSTQTPISLLYPVVLTAYHGFLRILLCGFSCLQSLCTLAVSPCEPILLLALLIHDSMCAVLLPMLLHSAHTFS